MSPPGSVDERSAPLISISIVSHGDWQPLLNALQSLTAQESIERIQLIVTDNLGADLPSLAPSAWHSIVVLRPERPRGFAANHNAAFQRAQGRYFCVLNPDVTFSEPALARLIEHMQAERQYIGAPILADSRGAVQDSFRDLPTPWGIIRRRLGRAATVQAPQSGRLLFPDWIAGMFMLMRGSTFSELGGFDEHYRMYFEDVDLCTRLRLRGGGVFVDPSIRLQHDPRRTSRRPGRHLLWHTQSALRFFLSQTYREARRLGRNA